MLADEVGSVVTSTSTLTRRLHVVELTDNLAKAVLEQLVSRNPSVVLVVEVPPLHLVLESLLELLTTQNHLHLALLAVFADKVNLHLRLVLVRERSSGLFEHFTVVAVLVTPLDVGDRGLFEMLVEMVESVLCDVSDTKGGVLVDLAFLRDGFTGEQLDEGGFTSTIGSEDTHTAAQTEGAGDILEGGFGGTRVGEGTVAELHDGTGV
jgi:hypothetical protein